MTCNQAQAALATGAAETAELRAHLDGCNACRDEAAALAQLTAALRTVAARERAVAPEVDLVPGVRAAWARQQAALALSRRRRRWSAVAVGLAAAAAALLLVAGRLRPPPPSPRPLVVDAGGSAADHLAFDHTTFDPAEDVDPATLLDELDAAALARVAAALEEGA